MATATRYASGVGSAATYMLIHSRLDRVSTTRRGIICLLGGGSNETSWQSNSPTSPNISTLLLERLSAEGAGNRIITIAANWEWGNPTTVTRIDDAWSTGRFAHNFSDDKVHLIGISMGATGCLNWARRNPESVASVSLVIGAVDIEDIEANANLGAWGVTAPSTAYGGSVPPVHNPIRQASAFYSLPLCSWYSNNDAVCRKTPSERFVTNSNSIGANLGDQFPSGFAIPGHAADNLPLNDVAAWIAAHDED